MFKIGSIVFFCIALHCAILSAPAVLSAESTAVLSAPAVLSAQDTALAVLNHGATWSGTLKSGFQVLVALAIVVTLIYGVLYFFNKKIKPGRMEENIVEVVAMKPVMQNRYIGVIQVADDIYVVGITDHAVNRIGEITSPESRLMVQAFKSMREGNAGMKFSEHLKNVFKKTAVNKEEGFDSVEFLNRQTEKLKELAKKEKDE